MCSFSRLSLSCRAKYIKYNKKSTAKRITTFLQLPARRTWPWNACSPTERSFSGRSSLPDGLKAIGFSSACRNRCQGKRAEVKLLLLPVQAIPPFVAILCFAFTCTLVQVYWYTVVIYFSRIFTCTLVTVNINILASNNILCPRVRDGSAKCLQSTVKSASSFCSALEVCGSNVSFADTEGTGGVHRALCVRQAEQKRA